MSDASFQARVGIEISPEGVTKFENDVKSAFARIAAEAQRRASSGESLSGITSQFQAQQTQFATRIGSQLDLPATLRSQLTQFVNAAARGAIPAIQDAYASLGRSGFNPLSPGVVQQTVRSSRTEAEAAALEQQRQAQEADAAARRAEQQRQVAAARTGGSSTSGLFDPVDVQEEADRRIIKDAFNTQVGLVQHGLEQIEGENDARTKARLAVEKGAQADEQRLHYIGLQTATDSAEGELSQQRLEADRQYAQARLRAAKLSELGLIDIEGETTSQTEARIAVAEAAKARKRQNEILLAQLDSELEVEQQNNQIRAAIAQRLKLTELGLQEIRGETTSQTDARIAVTEAANLRQRQNDLLRAQLNSDLGIETENQELRVVVAQRLKLAELGLTEVAGETASQTEARIAVAQAANTRQRQNDLLRAQLDSDLGIETENKALRAAIAQRVKLTEVGLAAVEGETVEQTQARIIGAQRVAALREQLVQSEALLATGSEESALLVQKMLLEKEVNRTLNARVQAEIKQRVESGALPGGSLFQQVQANISGRQGGTPKLPTDFATLGQTIGSRFLTTAGFAVSGLATYGLLTQLKQIYTSEQDVQQAFTIIDGQLRSLGQGGSIDQIHSQIADIATATGTAEASIAQIFPQIKGAFADSATALANAKDAAEFAKITRTDLAETSNALVPAALVFKTSFATITDSALGIQERTGVAAQRVIQLYGQLGPVAAQTGLSLKQVGAIAAAVLQDTARTPQSVAEDFNRLIPQLQGKASNIAAILSQGGGDGSSFLADIQSGKIGAAIENLVRQYQNLTPAAQDAVIAAAGSGRGAKDVTDLLLNQKVALNELNPALTSTGKTQEYFSNLQKTLGQQLASLREQLLQLGRALLSSGIGTAFQDVLTVVTLLIGGLKEVSEFFGVLNRVTDGVAARIAEIAVAAKALEIVFKAFTGDKAQAIFGTLANKIPGVNVGGGAAAQTTAAETFDSQVTGAAATFADTVVAAATRVAEALQAGGAETATELEAGGAAAGAEMAAGGAVGGGEQALGGAAVGLEQGAAGAAGGLAGVASAASLFGAILLVGGTTIKSSVDKINKSNEKVEQALQTASDAQVAAAAAKAPSTGQRIDRFLFSVPTTQELARQQQNSRLADRSGITQGVQGAIAGGISPVGALDFGSLGQSGNNAYQINEYIRKLRENGTKELPDLLKNIQKGDEGAIQVAKVYVDALRSNPATSERLKTAATDVQNALNNVPDPQSGLTPVSQAEQDAQAAIDSYTNGQSSLADTLVQLNTQLNSKFGEARDKVKAKIDTVVSKALIDDQNLADSLQNNDSSDVSAKIDAEVALFNTPEFNDPAQRLDLAKQIVANLKAQLTAEADAATNTADRNKILNAGISVPPEVRGILAHQLVDNNPLIQSFFSQLGAINDSILQSVTKDTIDLVSNQKSLGDALVLAIQAQLNELDAVGSRALLTGGQLGAPDSDSIAAQKKVLDGQLASAKSRQAALNATGGVAATVTGPPNASAAKDALATQDQLNKAQAELDSANAGKDPVAQARIAQQLAAKDLATAQQYKDDVKIKQAQAEQAKANIQMQDAQAQVAQANDQLDAARSADNPIAAAAAAKKLADDQLAAAQKAGDTIGVINAQIAQVNAQRTLTKSLADLAVAQMELVKSNLTVAGDVVGASKQQVDIIQKEISDALARGETKDNSVSLNALYGQLSQAQLDVTNTNISFTEQQVQDNLDLKRITVGQAVAQLRALEALAANQHDRDEIEKKVRQLLNASTDFQFNLPSVILPTQYEVVRAAQPGGYQDNRQVVIQSLSVSNGVDLASVQSMLSSALGAPNRVLTSAARRA